MTFIPLKEKFHLNAIPSEINVSCTFSLLQRLFTATKTLPDTFISRDVTPGPTSNFI